MKLKHALFATILTAASVPASAASLGVSIGFNPPGLHGTVQAGDFYRPYRPRVIYPQPVLVYPAPVVADYRPAYGHYGSKGYGHWKHRRHDRHCRH